MFKRLTHLLVFFIVSAFSAQVATAGGYSTFSKPVTSDTQNYRKFDSQAIAGKFHAGDDYYNSDLKALAANCGTVVAQIYNGQGDHGFGNALIIRHDLLGGVVYSLYGHLAAFDPAIAVNKPVAKGQRLGTIGATGSGSGGIVHLHFELKVGPTLANPLAFGSILPYSVWGYMPIAAGSAKATSAGNYGYWNPPIFYSSYVAICP